METLIVLLIAAGGVAAILVPLARGGGTPRRATATGPRFADDDAAIDAEVERYRAALRAGTICGRCRYPNPEGSNFCADCGRALGTEQG